jgi:hypothetical protein
MFTFWPQFLCFVSHSNCNLKPEMKSVFSFLTILLFIIQPISHVQVLNDNFTGQSTDQIAPIEQSMTSSLTGMLESSRIKIYDFGDSVESIHTGELSLCQYVTPEDQVITALTGKISEPKDAYEMAVQWTYVTDEKLNRIADKWLTPHEFLTDTPHYSSNPLQGKIVSDCEEKANTLVSLIRAQGVQPEEVRVVLGEVKFGNLKTGHAWVELLTDGQWLALDPCWGPYWDDNSEKLVNRQGVPFDYYTDHGYPVLQVWTYYNDTYFLDPRVGSGNAPTSWYVYPQ